MKKLTYMAAAIAVFMIAMQFCVFAADISVPFYVYDEADVIAEKVEKDIADRADVIYSQTGCRFAVAAVNFLGGTQIEDYSAALYEKNTMGNNGVLVVFSIAEEDYYMLCGEKLKQLSDKRVKEILEEYAEQDFAAGEYQSAITAVCDEVIGELEDIFSVTSDRETYDAQIAKQIAENEEIAKNRKVYFILFAVCMLVSLLFVLRMLLSFAFRAKRHRKTAKRNF